RFVHAAGKSGESDFAVGVGSGLEVEAADSGESVGDVHVDGSGVSGLGVCVVHGQLQRAWTGASVHDGDFLTCGGRGLIVWFGLTGREEARDDENRKQNGGRSIHGRNYISLPELREDTKNTSLLLSGKKNHLALTFVIPHPSKTAKGGAASAWWFNQ